MYIDIGGTVNVNVKAKGICLVAPGTLWPDKASPESKKLPAFFHFAEIIAGTVLGFEPVFPYIKVLHKSSCKSTTFARIFAQL